MADCNKCSHYPICNWVANNVEDFKLPAESGVCDLYDPCGTCAHKQCGQKYPCENGKLWEEKESE